MNTSSNQYFQSERYYKPSQINFGD